MLASYDGPMRTTIRLDAELLREAKQVAAGSGRTLTSLIEEALRERLARRQTAPERHRITLLTEPGGPLPGVNIDSSAALLDLMESDDPPRR